MSHWFMFDTASVITQDNGIQVTIEWSGTGVDSIEPLRGTGVYRSTLGRLPRTEIQSGPIKVLPPARF